MKKYYIQISLLFIGFIFIACGGTQIASTPKSDKIEIYTQKSILDSSKQKFYMEFQVYNGYENGIDVNLNNIFVNLNDCSIDNSTLSSNQVHFSSHSQKQFFAFSGTFSTPCTPTGYKIIANSTLKYENTENSFRYISQMKPLNFEEDNNISLDDVNTFFDYGINIKTDDNKNSQINLNSSKKYTISIVNLRDKTLLNKMKITSLKIKTSNPLKAKFQLNQNDTSLHNELSFQFENSIDFYIKSLELSGDVDITISAEYIDLDGNSKSLNKTIPLNVISNDINKFIINSTVTEYKADEKEFEQIVKIIGYDSYNNKINTNKKIIVQTTIDDKSYIHDVCENQDWNIELNSTDGVFQFDDKGEASISLRFSPYFIGKKVSFHVSSIDNPNQSKILNWILENPKGVKVPKDIPIDKNTTVATPLNFDFGLILDNSDDDIWVNNSRVKCVVESKNISISGHPELTNGYIFSDNHKITNPDECINNRDSKAYLNTNISLIDANLTGTLKFKSCQTIPF
ncbi:MAG: hypothetical protein KAU90_12465 [Sulfurovaceae bacterium]|nr:hypothetical protein [Sulfurovaceae bacterium]